MTQPDWFRHTTWTAEDASAFEEKLARSRGQRSEYLRIQAWTLADTRDPANAAPAIELAERFLCENPKDGTRASTLVTAALAETTRGDLEAAVEYYRRAVEVERTTRQMRIRAYLEFAWFVVIHGRTDLYSEVLAAINSNFERQDLVFPMTQYQYFGALALISSERGEREQAV